MAASFAVAFAAHQGCLLFCPICRQDCFSLEGAGGAGSSCSYDKLRESSYLKNVIGKEKIMEQQTLCTPAGPKTTPTDICRWAQELFRLHVSLAPRFARPEPHRRADASTCKGS